MTMLAGSPNLRRHAPPVRDLAVVESLAALPAELARHAPDAHGVAERCGAVIGRCSLWHRRELRYGGRRAGVLGHFAADCDAAAGALLDWACSRLAAAGCTLAVGPMDGHTWRSYRLVTEWGDAPPFLLEPHHGREAAGQFAGGGFAPLETYFSALVDDLARTDPRRDELACRMDRAGVTIRPLEIARWERELGDMYAVARQAFGGNPFFVDIGAAEFVREFADLASRLPSELTWIARDRDRPAGFVFAYPDLLQTARPVDAVVVKTLAVAPDRRYAGLGRLLLATVQRRAHELGFTRAIHALVRDAPHLRRISARSAAPFRRYALFGKALP